jgi:alcohol dehydrogenase
VTWRHHNPVEIVFGPGVRARLGAYLAGSGSILVVTSKGGVARGWAELVASHVGRERTIIHDEVEPNPDVKQVDACRAGLAGAGIAQIVAIGGGSVLDFAKLVAASLGAGAGIGALVGTQVAAETTRALRLVALPTTAGTGSEVTPFATVWDHAAKRKLSVGGSGMYPSVALVDPELMLGLPEATTVATGLDAVSQALESVWNRHATPVSRALAAQAVAQGVRALPRLVDAPDDLGARTAMAEAALLAGLCISQTRTALCHSISYPITAHFGVPHGLAVAMTLVPVAQFNVDYAPEAFEGVAAALGCEVREMPTRLADFLRRVRLTDFVRPHVARIEQLLPLVPEMFTPDRADNNLRPVASADIEALVRQAWL